MKIGLLIQGPIISQGRTGSSPSNIVLHDSSSNVIDLIHNLSKNDFDEILISTWKSSESLELSMSKELPSYVEFLHISENEMKNECIIDDIDNNSGSKYYQYYLTYRGILELKSKGIDYVIKCRTDQLIDLKKLKKFIVNQPNFDDRFFVTHLEKNKPFWVNDFYFGASIKNMDNIFKSLLFSRSFSGSVHTDLFRAITNNSLTLSNEFPKLFVFLKNHKLVAESKRYENYYKYIINDVIQPFPRSVYTSIIWRGKLLHKKAYSEYIFSEENNINLYNKKESKDTQSEITLLDFLIFLDLKFIIWNKFGVNIIYSSKMSKFLSLFFKAKAKWIIK
jgi:hypothetical protein